MAKKTLYARLAICLLLPALTAAEAPIPSNPLVSRGRSVRANLDTEGAAALVDGLYGRSGAGTSWMPGGLPAWVAINVGSGFQRLLLCWSSPGNSNYTSLQGVPVDYQLDVSADSTDGTDGSWSTVASVSGNAVKTRAHSFAFAGDKWVRMLITKASDGVNLDEIDVHDISSGAADSWFFMGDSITAIAYDRSEGRQPSFAVDVANSFPGRFPVMLDGGVFGDLSSDGVRRIDAWLSLNPDVRHWAIGFGTNDSGHGVAPDAFKANLQTLVRRVSAAGRVPLLAMIPRPRAPGYDSIPVLNERIDEVVAENGLTPGPNFYAWFSEHPEEIGSDGVHPTDAGAASMNRLWAQAVSGLYAAPAPDPSPGPQPPTDGTATAGPKRNDRNCGLLGADALAILLVAAAARPWRGFNRRTPG